jgi:carbonic anhydrase
MPYSRPASPQAALDRLLDGNRRFVAETAQYPIPSAERIKLASGQEPFAVVIGCSDSRVPVETVFDQPAGNLFVARLAGNIVSDYCIASAEYAVSVLHSVLIVVLGHSRCGAVQSAIQLVESGTSFPGYINLLADALAPVAERTRDAEDWWQAAVEENVRTGKERILRESALIREAAASGKILVAAAVYDLSSGVVRLLD